MLVVAPVVFAANPGFDPGAEHLSGAALVGTVTVYPTTPSGIGYTFVGKCKGKEITFGGFHLISYDLITEAKLDKLRDVVPKELSGVCAPIESQEWVIWNVIKYAELPSLPQKMADVVILFVIPR
jgi:hypothetical protein